MIGGGMLIPLGAVFNDVVLEAGNAGFGTILVTLGVGVAAGVSILSVVQRRLAKDQAFVGAVLGAGICLLFDSRILNGLLFIRLLDSSSLLD